MPSHSHTRGTMNITGNLHSDYITIGSNQSGGALYTGTTRVVHYGPNNSSGNWTGDLYFDASRNWTGTTSEEGNGVAHNNMQPFISVFMFKRTA